MLDRHLITAAGVGVAVGASIFAYKHISDVYPLNGKVVLITGASSGIGEALAHEFYTAGSKVILAARNIKRLNEVKREIVQKHGAINSVEPQVLYLDLEDIDSLAASLQSAVQLHGVLDVLVNNAGVSCRGSAADTEIGLVQRVICINFLGQIALTQAALKHMMPRGSGYVVCMSSIQGRCSLPHRAAYGASKHALQAYMDSLRSEIRDSGVRVLVVCPSYTRTSLGSNALSSTAQTDEDTQLQTGMPAATVARALVKAVRTGKSEILVGPFLHRLIVYIRTLFPNLLFYIMSKRADSNK